VGPGRRLRVAFDATSLLGSRTGVGEVTWHLLESLVAFDDLDLAAYAITWRGRGDLEGVVPPGVDCSTRPFPARATRVLWPRLPRPKIEQWTGPVDLVHATSFVAPPSDAPVLVTIHDLTFVRFPEMCIADTLTYPRLLGVAFERGAIVHTYSDFVAAEVREHFDLPDDRVLRVYPGLAPTADGDPARGRQVARAERYVLALATVEPRKNLPALVRAFDHVAAGDGDLHLVVAGPSGWGAEEFDAACAAAHHADRIHHLGYVAAHDRRDLLAGAAALAFPSVYEGFGHPPLEAMQARVPVVASSAGALPEVLGDAALLPDPADDDAIADALARVLTDDALRRELIERGTALTRHYSWERQGSAFAQLYRDVAATPSR
jgi:glycosyltransferase involved in cell wall biosynthesis